jgi:hypothetical protein
MGRCDLLLSPLLDSKKVAMAWVSALYDSTLLNMKVMGKH